MKLRIIAAIAASIALLSSNALAMKASAIPTKFPVPFAASATGSFIRSIPQTSTDPCAASLNLGFPPNTFQPLAAGGCPPDGRDFNGILNQATAWNQWLNAAGPIAYDPTFSTAINGYPKGTVLTSATFGQFWISTVDDNTSDPDTGGANWIGFTSLNLYAVDSGTTNAYVASFIPNYSAPIDGVTVTVKILNANSGASTLNGVTIVRRDGSALIGNELVVGQDARFTYVGSSNRYQLLGIAPATAAVTATGTDAQSAVTPAGFLAQFTGSNQNLVASGYQKFPGGLIIQWGNFSQAANSGVLRNFNIAFPNAALSVVMSLAGAPAGDTGAPSATIVSASQFNSYNSNTAGAVALSWFAIGF